MTMPAGEYYVGDLGYVFEAESDVWEESVELDSTYGELALDDGRRYAMYPTWLGDGIYKDNLGREYSNDTGTFGCILLSDLEADADTSLGQIIKFESEFATRERRGVISFGDVDIQTRVEEYGHEMEDEDCEDE